ncbi:replication initiation protein RepC [Novosphingobium sp. 9U]|uniref:replication initiation protein RepC n=1 Tax=Novosphingobium sp. 9U TaxID=2653158 RepID=UPI00135A6CA5|nr:replication initiation protein RepC [Novosphingobium sp. 9U]
MQLGRLLQSVRVPIEFDGNGLPILEDAAAIADWERHCRRLLQERFGQPSTLAHRTAAGRDIRRAVLQVLRRLENGSTSAGITRKQIATLRQLVLMCAREQDWASATGPIVGARNSEIARRLGGRDPAEALKPLIRHGLIAPHKRRGNGHRYFKVLNKGQDHEMIEASGFAIAPAIVLLESLELIASYEEHLVEQHIALPRQIAATLNEARGLLAPFAGAEWTREAEQEIKSINERSHNAKKGGLERKRAVLDDAEALLARLEARVQGQILPCADSSAGVEIDPLGGETTPHIYSETYDSHGSCSGDPGDRSGNESALPPAPAQCESDEFGISRTGFEWSEVPELFPFTRGMIQIDARYLRPAAMTLARLIGIGSLGLIERAIATMGLEAAVMALLVTGQHSADGQIRRTPEVYLRGLMKRGREKDLNLGHTIFGRRELSRKAGSTDLTVCLDG